MGVVNLLHGASSHYRNALTPSSYQALPIVCIESDGLKPSHYFKNELNDGIIKITLTTMMLKMLIIINSHKESKPLYYTLAIS